MKPRTKTWLRRLLLYPAFFVFCFLIFCYLTFPYDRLRDWITYRASDGGMQLEIDDLSPSFLTGLVLTGVRIRSIPSDPTERIATIELSEVSARVSVLSALGGTLGLSYDALLGSGGEIEGTFDRDGEALAVEAELTDVDLRSVGHIRRAVGIPIGGRISGTIRLNAPAEGGIGQAEGNVELRVAGASLGDGRAKLMIPGQADGLTVNRIALGDFPLRITVQHGTATIEEVHVASRDVALDLTGALTLRDPVRHSGIRMTVRVKPTQGYLDRSPNIAGLLAIAEMNPRISAARTPEGAFAWTLNGPLSGGVSFRPAGRTAGRLFRR